MVEDNFSCIKEVTKVVHITLPTACTSNEISGISDVLDGWKRQYIQQLQAVVVSYKNVSLTSSHGFIKLDYPFILHDVKATFELFYPTVGSIVKGKINRISQDYIGCLVHNTINVTINRSNYTSKISHFVALDRFVLFEITRLDYKRKIIHVKGEITKECVRLMEECGMISTDIDTNDNVFISTSQSSNESSKEFQSGLFLSNLTPRELSTDSGHHSPKKKKSKKLHKISPERNLSPCSTVRNSELENSDTSSPVSPIKKKKRKKSTHDLLTSPPLFSESLESEASSLLSPPSKNKKHKVSKEDALNNILIEITPKSSPKKKHKKSKSGDLSADFKNVDMSVNVKQEVNSDSQNSFASPKKSNKKSNKFPENFNDVYEMMEAFSAFEPSPEAQLLDNKASLSGIKEEPLDAVKVSRKRKHESSDMVSLSNKKRKIKDGNSSNKDKKKAHEEKKKKKEKSKKDSKKDKEKKSKIKVISTKKNLHGYKNKLKKEKKEKPERTKKKKSLKQKKKVVP